jgi:phosphotransferase system enzyme I (PtsI)
VFYLGANSAGPGVHAREVSVRKVIGMVAAGGLMYKGIAVSPGVVVGTAFKVESVFGPSEPVPLDDASQVPAEIERLEKAIELSVGELQAIATKVDQELGPSEAAIFRTHLQIARDRQLVSRVRDQVRTRHLTALSALQQVLQVYAATFAQMEQDFFRERMADIRDVVTRIGGHLADRPTVRPKTGTDAIILVAHELLPSQAMELGELPIRGIVTEAGGATSHAAILARSLGIPAVSGVVGITQEVRTGDLLAVDGRDGLVLARPDTETAAAYRKMEREFFLLKDRLVNNRDHPAVSSDGAQVELLANINNLADTEAACAVGATGVGLFRTEYLFISHPAVPDEEEQYEHYRQIIEAAPNRVVTIRTLDVGGDKTLPYLGRRDEANPFMGWRSIRLSFEHPRIFERQIRAILRAGRHGHVQMLFPMITTLEELRYVNRLVDESRRNLRRERIPFGEDVKCGVMIEVPAAAVCIDAILRETDFVSIGSNDLIQYLVAADRDNPKVAHLCEPLSPAIFRVIQMVLDAAHRTATRVTVCGEMAGQPRAVLVLFGLGLRRFSMSPAFIPMIKSLLASVSTPQAERFAHQVLQLKTSEEIRSYLNGRLHEVSSTLELFDFT